ncbi:hypothetical protein Jolie1_086 [Mycobacterium phage Julie1]|jgi:hypothetical protein|uniref:Uncharacterized protein n=1 Tax=Mycobacterium phage Julie1 TaxID=1463812 RepID=W8ECT3_9CAUD|nr:hypothetical protein CG90_gp86 [Mycobacterium phage Julie1]YP_009032310.1 hypothetical protein FH38_gp84 [Mycobacterium phage Hosp]AHJ88586.1 hypothetical protein Jolie1_086 [Mycobacterium phage Julie1]AHK12038.1 hypothetical protein Hosp_084 [Mycobacterium phage Hosp]
MSRELLLPLELTRPPRCPGSGEWPHRNYKGRAECQICGKRFAPKLDGRVRRHPAQIKYLPVRVVDIPD